MKRSGSKTSIDVPPGGLISRSRQLRESGAAPTANPHSGDDTVETIDVRVTMWCVHRLGCCCMTGFHIVLDLILQRVVRSMRLETSGARATEGLTQSVLMMRCSCIAYNATQYVNGNAGAALSDKWKQRLVRFLPRNLHPHVWRFALRNTVLLILIVRCR